MPNGMGHGNGDFVGGVGGWADQQQQQQHAAATMGGAPPRPDMAGEFGIMSPAGGAMARPFSTMGMICLEHLCNGSLTRALQGEYRAITTKTAPRPTTLTKPLNLGRLAFQMDLTMAVRRLRVAVTADL